MPLDAAAGAISTPQETFRAHLADCDTFRALVGAANQAEALTRIHQGALIGPASGDSFGIAELSSKRPYAIIWTEPQAGLQKSLIDVGGEWGYTSRGNLVAYLERDWPSSVTRPDELERAWQNTIGAIVNELLALAGQAGYLPIRELTVHGPFLADPDEAQSYGESIGYYLDVLWGPP